MRPHSPGAGLGSAVGSRTVGISRLSFVAERLRGPAGVLLVLIVAQWIEIAIFTTTIDHNGWLFYQGGDQTFFYTTAWVVAHGHIPVSDISYGWSFLIAPFAAIFGPDILRAFPAIMLLQVVVLLPVALLCVYGIAARIGGRAFGYFAAAVWVVGPFLAIPLWHEQYHDRYVDQFLPQAFGLSGLADSVSAVAILVAAYVVVRALDSAAPVDAVLAGIAAGFAIGIKPSNALFLPAPLIAFVVARRFRQVIPFGLALLPAVFTLAVWKLKGLGSLPLFPSATQAVAAGAGFVAAPPAASIGHYIHFDYAQLHDNYLGLREYFWSVRLLQWLPIAGVVGVARRAPAVAMLLAVWLGTFLVLKGSAEQVNVSEGTFLRLFLPALPAFALLAIGVPLLWPRLRLFAARPLRRPLAASWRAPAFVASATAFAVIPAVLVAALPPLRSPSAAKISPSNTFLTVTNFGLRASRDPQGVARLSWRSQASGPARAFYTVFRQKTRFRIPKGSPPFPIVHGGMFCQTPERWASRCTIEMTAIAKTRGTTFAESPPLGDWTYRVAVTANWLNNIDLGDPLMISEPVSIVVR